jgi:FkbM family methyltransferase
MKSFVKKIIPTDSKAYKVLERSYRWLRGRPNYWECDIVELYAGYNSSIFFIQIGSNDGMHGDPISDFIKKKGWRGILVEPVPYLFDRLKSNYTNFAGKLIFENSAIADKNGTLDFYRLEKSDLPDLPEWYDQLGSFKKEVVLKHRNAVPSFDDLFIKDSVNAITFKDLIKKHSVVNVNLIHIDTEGYDYEIIKMIPFKELNADIIMFEHKHLNDQDYFEAIKLLRKNGYKVGKKDFYDSIAVRRSVLKKLVKKS